MASKKRRRCVPSSAEEDVVSLMSEEESLSSSIDGSTTSSLVDEIQVEFEARPIVRDDFHGVRNLVQELFYKSCVDVTGLTEAILGQHNIGSTIKVCEEREYQSDSEGGDEPGSPEWISGRGAQQEEKEEVQDVLGISTVLPLSKKGSPSIASVRNHLLAAAKKFASNGVTEKLVDLMAQDECKLAFLVHERFVNIPPEIGPPLLQTLVKEVKELLEKENNYTHYLVLTRTSLASLTDSFPGKRKRKKKDKKLGFGEAVESGEVLFDFPELEQLYTKSILSFTYPLSDCEASVQESADDDTELYIPCRTVFLVARKKFFTTVNAMGTQLTNSQS